MAVPVQPSKINFTTREVVLLSVACVLVLCLLLGLLIVGKVFRFDVGQHFTYLAESFLQGKPYFTNLPPIYHGDLAAWGGRLYWPLGPFPAVLMAPFVYLWQQWFSAEFYSNYLQTALTMCVAGVVFGVARRQLFSQLDSFYLALAWLYSIFLAVAVIPSSYFFANLVAVTLLWAAIFEYLGKRRYVLLGVYLGLALATRVTVGLAVVFFLADLGREYWKSGRVAWRYLVRLLVPFTTCGFLVGLYNYARFGSLFDLGYAHQRVLYAPIARALEYGQFSLIHLPSNLYYAFLAAPQPVFRDGLSHVLAFPFIKPDLWGMSIFFASPMLGYLLLSHYRSFRAWAIIGTALAIATPLLLYYGIGYVQFGYRYALDFLPFLFWLFMIQYRSHHTALSYSMKVLIVGSAVLNAYLFGVYLGLPVL